MLWAPVSMVVGVFLQSVLFCCTLLFSYFRKDFGAVLWVLGLISVYVFFYASVFGQDVGSHWVLLPIMFGIPVLLDSNNLRIVAGYASVPLTVFIALELTDYSLFGFLLEDKLTPTFLNNLYILNLSLAIFATLLVLYYNFSFFREKVQRLVEREMALVQTSRLGKIGYCEVDLIEEKIHWSPELREILGIAHGQNSSIEEGLQLVAPEDYERIAQKLHEVSSREYSPSNEFVEEDLAVIRQKDNKKLYLSTVWNIWPNASGKPARMTVVIKDITENKEQEQAIQAEKELAIEANHAKSRFLTNMSHEIRTPLNGILGFTDLLLQSPLDDDQRSQVQLIKSSGDTLLALLSDLLDLSKIEAGKLQLEEKVFHFFDTARECINPYQIQAREKGLNLEWEIDQEIPAYIFADPVRFRQILVNLLSNAIKYTQAGSIQVKIGAKGLQKGHDTFMLEASVMDSGIGIPATEQQDIFNAFHQSSMTTVEEYGGTGLGLAIVNELVKMMSGSVRVKSPVFHNPSPHGSMFSFEIQVQQAEPPGRHAKAPQTGSSIHHTKREPLKELAVLIAEDNEVNQILARKVLENMGASVTVVDNGKKAVEAAADQALDLILMDIKMPVMNGYEATGLIRQFQMNIPIIALSANAYKEDIEASFAAGMDGHISKPFRPEELLRVIDELQLRQLSS